MNKKKDTRLSFAIWLLAFAFLQSITTEIAKPMAAPVDLEYANWKAPASVVGRKNPFAGKKDHAQAGKKLFRQYCSSCHGKEAEGAQKTIGLATNRIRKAPEGSLFWYIRNGNLRAGMPAWSRIPDQQIWQIVTFLQTEK